jgi:Mor family transcriptional regulator
MLPPEKIDVGMLPAPYRRLVDIVGLKNTLRIADALGGERVYFPRLAFAGKYLRDEEIREQFNGYNARELARKYGLSERRIRQIVGK